MKKVLRMVLILAILAAAGSAHAFGWSTGSSDVSTLNTANALTGKVAETMNSGGYTYISLERENTRTWIAVPQTEVKVGQEISVIPGMTMSNFESKTLHRTFESIIFSPGLASGSPEGAGAGTAHGSSSAPAKLAEEPVKVEKASGPNAYTVAEIYDKKRSLESKNVVVRGKVVKVSTNIMDTNWIHIQDGSGDASSGTHDLLITSDDVPSIGDIITANGKIVNDKDIGSGYKFAVMIEQAKIKK
jgi:hypothetical protein